MSLRRKLNLDDTLSMDVSPSPGQKLEGSSKANNCSSRMDEDSPSKKVKQLACYECNKTFPSTYEVVTHLKLIHNACASRDCSQLSNFILHSPICANRDLVCILCNEKFQERNLLLIHFNQHIDAAFYACDVCKEGFQQRRELQKHFFQIHNKFLSIPVTSAFTKTVYQKCHKCSKYFKLFAELEEHVSSCNSLTYACSICNVGFSLVSELEQHKVTEHKTHQSLKGYMALRVGKRYFCGICYLGFFKGSSLRQHVFTHGMDMTFVCDVCNVCFSCNNDLQTHYVQHVEEYYHLHAVISQHLCSFCLKTFKTQKELKDHMSNSCGNNSKNTQTKKVNAKGDELETENNFADDDMTDLDFSNIPVYVLKTGEDLLNCEDSQCVIVMDLTSLFVLQRGVCGSTGQMPDVKDSEVYSEAEVVDASLLENHMMAILSPSIISSPADDQIAIESATYFENNPESENMQTIVVNINDANEIIMQSEEEFVYPENVNGKHDFVVYGDKSSPEPYDKVIAHQNETSCNKKFVENEGTEEKELFVETNTVDINELHICDICRQVFSTKTSLSLHIKGSHTGNDCYQCGESFNSEKELKKHEKDSHQKEFHCDSCEVSYSSETLLENHKEIVHEATTYICNLCNHCFLAKNEYEVHLMSHKTEAASTKCEDCGKVFVSVTNYIKHRATHENKISSKKYLCTICDKSFIAHSSLKLHLATHVRKSPYDNECPKCKMYFPQKLLPKHLEMHVEIVS